MTNEDFSATRDDSLDQLVQIAFGIVDVRLPRRATNLRDKLVNSEG